MLTCASQKTIGPCALSASSAAVTQRQIWRDAGRSPRSSLLTQHPAQLVSAASPRPSAEGSFSEAVRWGQDRTARFIVTAARNDDYAEYDDDDESSNLLGGVWGTASGLINGLTGVVAEVIPDSVPRPIVDVAVKAGLVLAALSLARSLLSVALTIGTIVLGLWLFSQLSSNNRGGGSRGQPGWQQQRSRRRPPLLEPERSRLPPGGFGIGGDSDSELADVWFEPDNGQRVQRGSRHRS